MTEKTVTDDNIEDVTVSVVIPYSESYTPREMLTEAIESIESQIGVDTDVIVIEDSDERGPAWARNVGLDRAETRYVAFLDADDLWEETKLVKQLRLMKETGTGMCVDGEQSYSPLEFAGALLTAETFGLTSSILIDTEKVDVRFDESLERREDHLYMIEAAAERGICFSADTFIARKNEEGLSQHVDSSPEQIDEFFEKVVDQVPEVERFKSPYYQNSYIYLGRLRHFDKEYRTAIRYYLKSLRYGPNIKAVGAIGLTVLMLLYEYPLRPIRKHVTSSSVHE